MTNEQAALAALLGSFLDLLNGYPVRELHEPPQDTIRRAHALLPPDVRDEFDIPEGLV